MEQIKKEPENKGNETPGEIIKLDEEFNIGEIRPNAEEEEKNEEKLQDVEECIKEVKALAFKLEQHRYGIQSMEADINALIDQDKHIT